MKWIVFTLALFSIPAWADNCANLPAQTNLPWNGQGAAPVMGWDTWYAYGQAATEAEVKTNADALVSTGLLAAGWNFVSLDDGWEASARSSGQLVGDATKFPDGIAATFTYIHTDGEKAGIYSSPNTTTCGGNPGSGTFESTDAATFASWGADSLKYDGCNVSTLYTSCWSTSAPQVWQMMAQDVTTAGRAMVLNLGTVNTASDPQAPGSTWGKNAGFNAFRASDLDIAGNWSVFDGFIDTFAGLSSDVGKGFWADCDYLQGPVSTTTQPTGWTFTQMQTQFGMCAMWSSPLVISAAISNLTTPMLNMYKNASVIAIDQDTNYTMATRYSQTVCGSTHCEVWSKHLSTGAYAIALLNRDTTAGHTVSVTFSGITGSTLNDVKEDWNGTGQGLISSYSVSLPAMGMDIVEATPATAQSTTAVHSSLVNLTLH